MSDLRPSDAVVGVDWFEAPPRKKRLAAPGLLLVIAAACGAWSTFAFWHGRAASMTPAQAIDTIRNSPDAERRRSAIAALALQIEANVDLLHTLQDEPDPVGQYARIALRRIQEASKR